jgi:chaperonin GroES
MKIRPLQDRVVVRRTEEETTTAGGIVLPGFSNRETGPGRSACQLDQVSVSRTETPSLLTSNVGDTVVFGKYSSNTVKIDDEELLILNESEIFGVIES